MNKEFPKFMKNDYTVCYFFQSGLGCVVRNLSQKLAYKEGDIETFEMVSFVDCDPFEGVKKEPEEKPFPKYMQTVAGRVVYFTSPQRGILVLEGDTPDRSPIGYSASFWVMSYFEDCKLTCTPVED